MDRITSVFRNLFAGLRTRWGRLSRIQQAVVSVISVAVLIAIGMHIGTKPEEATAPDRVRQVELASVSDLSGDAAPLSLVGKVSSVSEATILSESSGKIRVYRKLGDYVPAGSIIAEFENSGERAAVLSAEGAYQAALAARDIAGISRGSAGNTLSEARTSALNTINSVYTSLDDAIRQKTDVMWSNPQARDPRLIFSVSDSKLVIDLEQERIALEDMLVTRESHNASLTTSSDLSTELTAVEAETRQAAKYLDDLSLALSRAIPDARITNTQIDSWKTVTSIARQSVNGALASITGSRNALQAATAATAIAEKNAGDDPDAAAADAQVKSVFGALEGARVRLDKTIIRSPISGTINSLSVDTGDFVSPFSPVAIVSNNGALEIVAYVTENDVHEFALGDTVNIEGGAKGVVTRIAPAIDPRTKKIEVKIGIVSGKGLVNGQTVALDIARSSKQQRAVAGPISLPLSTIKLTPQGSYVFTVDASSTARAHEIVLGALQGDRVSITNGVTLDMEIIIDARGLKDGMVIGVKQ